MPTPPQFVALCRVNEKGTKNRWINTDSETHSTSTHTVFVSWRVVQKLSRLKLYLPRQKGMMNKMLIFFKILTLALNPASFTFVKEPQKQLFWYGVKLYPRITFNILQIIISYSWDEFSTDWFQRHVSPSRVILCQGVRELHSLYVHIHILYFLIHLFIFVHSLIKYE